jgi:spore germination protein GerM
VRSTTTRRALAALAAAALVSCGIARDAKPRAIDKSSVPYDLLSPTTGPSTTLAQDVPTQDAIVYLIDERNRFVKPVTRAVPRPVSLSQTLRQLIDTRPDEREVSAHLSNLITKRTKLIEVRVDSLPSGPSDNLVTVNLDQFFPGLTSEDVSLAIAQVVFTVDTKVCKSRVEFQVRGRREGVRAADGTTKWDVSTDDFRTYLPPNENSPTCGSTSTTRTG